MNNGWKGFAVAGCVELVAAVLLASSSGGVLGFAVRLPRSVAWFLAVGMLGGRLMMLLFGCGCGIVGAVAIGVLWLVLLSAVLVGS